MGDLDERFLWQTRKTCCVRCSAFAKGGRSGNDVAAAAIQIKRGQPMQPNKSERVHKLQLVVFGPALICVGALTPHLCCLCVYATLGCVLRPSVQTLRVALRSLMDDQDESSNLRFCFMLVSIWILRSLRLCRVADMKLLLFQLSRQLFATLYFINSVDRYTAIDRKYVSRLSLTYASFHICSSTYIYYKWKNNCLLNLGYFFLLTYLFVYIAIFLMLTIYL